MTTCSITTNAHHKNWPLFIMLALLPVAVIAHGSFSFWTEQYQLSAFGHVMVAQGEAAQILGLVMTSIGWAALWCLTPLVGAPKRCAVCMSGLAAFWTVLFIALHSVA